MPEIKAPEQENPFRRHGDGCFKTAGWLVIAAVIGMLLLVLGLVAMLQGLKH